MALKIDGLSHITEMPLTCKPNPPVSCGVPSKRASLRRLHSGSCSILPSALPKMLIWNAVCTGMRQLSLPPPPMTVGAAAVGTGVLNGAEPAPL